VTPAQSRQWRFYADSLIDQAITILNEIDGDADLEAGRDGEPSLASPVGGESQICWCAGSDDDRELSHHVAASGLTCVSGNGPFHAR
jgi:hypothetical protein